MDDIHEQRSTLLSILLSGAALCGVLAASFLLCGGLAALVLAVVAGLAALGYFHYLLWGQALSDEVAGEREDAEARRQRDQDDSWTGNGQS